MNPIQLVIRRGGFTKKLVLRIDISIKGGHTKYLGIAKFLQHSSNKRCQTRYS